MKIPIFPGKYRQNGGFSMAMLVYRRVVLAKELVGVVGFLQCDLHFFVGCLWGDDSEGSPTSS